jgi:hypothetical protein
VWRYLNINSYAFFQAFCEFVESFFSMTIKNIKVADPVAIEEWSGHRPVESI